jgi:ABC-type multidrug transport system fused ATPase/permease subunit
MLYDPIRRLNKVNLVLQEALAAAQRVSRLLAVPNEIADRPGARAAEKVLHGVAYEGVCFSYDGRRMVLRELDLAIRAGEIVALVGSSGAGKSTLVNLLPRFFDPDRGRVAIDGVDIRDLRLGSLRSLIGIVTQETVLFNDSVRHNIAYGRTDLPLERVREAAAAAYADEFIMQLPQGYDTVIGESGLRLSGGQRQRLAIARTLVHKPGIYLFDDSFSALDYATDARLRAALSAETKDATVIIVAQRVATIRNANRIIVLDHGRVAGTGTHAELMASSETYREIVLSQMTEQEAAA